MGAGSNRTCLPADRLRHSSFHGESGGCCDDVFRSRCAGHNRHVPAFHGRKHRTAEAFEDEKGVLL